MKLSSNINIPELYNNWREQARAGLIQKILPEKMRFLELDQAKDQLALVFDERLKSDQAGEIKISKEFIQLTKAIACHRDPDRWQKLYNLLWRLTNERRDLLNNLADPLVLNLLTYKRQIRRDRHKMTAFVRFRQMPDGTFFAYYRPENFIVEYTADFFHKRFGNNIWSIATPHRSVSWDKKTLIYSPGIESDPFEGQDQFEEMWCDYYQSIFNPARVSVSAMKNEMPVKYWSTMPETRFISKMLAEAPKRVELMKNAPAAAVVPVTNSLQELNSHLKKCSACELTKFGGEALPGFGNPKADIIIVSEQPSTNNELLFEKVKEAGLSKTNIYFTTVVKHAKILNSKQVRPTGNEINCCKPWLTREIEIIKPKVIVLLGGLAAQAILGKSVNIKEEHLQVHLRHNAKCYVTWDLDKVSKPLIGKNPNTDFIYETLERTKQILMINKYISMISK